MLSLVALLAASAFQVEGAGSCPRPEQVKARLDRIAAEGDHVVELHRLDDRLQVRLLDSRGDVVGERDLIGKSSCEELAEATAVLVSAWTIDVPALELPVLEPTPPAQEEPPPAPVAAPPVVARAPMIVPTPFTPAVQTEIAPEHRSRHDLTAGFSVGVGSRFTSAAGIAAAYDYWFLDGLAVEASIHGHFAHGAQAPFEQFFVIPDFYTPTFVFSANIVPSFARGPARLAGLWPGPGVELYGALGVGIGNVRNDVFSDDVITAIFQAGAGLRFHVFREAIAIETELRDLFFIDPDGGVTDSVHWQAGLRVGMDASGWKARDQEDRPTTELGGRLVLTPMAGIAPLDSNVIAGAISGAATYEIFEFLGVELVGSYLFPSTTDKFDQQLEAARLTPEPAKLTQLLWAFGGGVRINALRGRFSPLGVAFDGDLTLYFAGGAAIGQSRTPCVPGLQQNGSECLLGEVVPLDGVVYGARELEAIGYAAGGLQLDFNDWFGGTVEFRDFIFDSHVFRPDGSDPFLADTRAIRHVALLQIGATFLLL
jgi:hypothetical protein